MIKERCQIAYRKKLNDQRQTLSRGKEIEYTQLETRKYLSLSNNLTIEEMKNIMRIRIRDIDVKANFPNYYKDRKCSVPECKAEETNSHIFNCKFLGAENDVVEKEVEYENIFSDDAEKQANVARIFVNRMRKRKTFIPLHSKGALDPRLANYPSLGIKEAREKFKQKGRRSKIKGNSK